MGNIKLRGTQAKVVHSNILLEKFEEEEGELERDNN